MRGICGVQLKDKKDLDLKEVIQQLHMLTVCVGIVMC